MELSKAPFAPPSPRGPRYKEAMRAAGLALTLLLACNSSAPAPADADDAAGATAAASPAGATAPPSAEPTEPESPSPAPTAAPAGVGADGAGAKEPPADAPAGGPPELVALAEEVDVAKAEGDADACMEKILAVSALTKKLHALGPQKEGPRVDALMRAMKAYPAATSCLLAANRCDDAKKAYNLSTESYDKGTLPDAAVHAVLTMEGKKVGSTCAY